MIDRDTQLHERWSPHGRRGGAATIQADAILAGHWLSNPVHATRQVDLHAAYRALAHEGMADRLFDAGPGDLVNNLGRRPHIEHLAGVRITYNNCGTTVTLGHGEPPPADERHVDQLCAEIVLRKGNDPPRTMRVPADIACISDRAEDGFVLGRSSGITAEEATEAMLNVFDTTSGINAAGEDERDRKALRDSIEEEAVRILEGESAATLRRIHNAAKRCIEPVMPAGRGAWIEVDTDGRIQVGFR